MLLYPPVSKFPVVCSPRSQEFGSITRRLLKSASQVEDGYATIIRCLMILAG
jgi:hypothetical protein